MRKRRLIVHCGAPKTGTSALQSFLAREQSRLADRGILYPTTGQSESPEPKHQWIVPALLRDDRAEVERRFAEIEAECDERTHTIVISTEGIYNHWFDFRPEPRRWFAGLRETYDVDLWLWLRDPVSFYRSYYLQCLRNPPVDIVPAYSTDRSPRELLDDPWVARHLDYARFCREAEATFGSGSLFVFAYSDRIVEQACALLRFPLPSEIVERRNVTVLNAAGVAILRRANRYPFDYVEKERAYALAVQFSELIGERSIPFELSAKTQRRVQSLATELDADLKTIDARNTARWMKTRA